MKGSDLIMDINDAMTIIFDKFEEEPLSSEKFELIQECFRELDLYMKNVDFSKEP